MKKLVNRYKFLIILFLLVLTTGCSVNYNVVVRTDNRVEENISIFRDKKEVLKRYPKLSAVKKDETEKLKLEYYKKQYGYSSRYVRKFSGLDLKLYKTSKTLTDFFENSFYKSLYSSYELIDLGDTVSFRTVGSYTPVGIFTTENGEITDELAKEIIVNIQFHRNVLRSNADYVNKLTNTYTWVIKNTDEYKNISFEIGNKKNYLAISYYYLVTNIVLVFISIFVIIVPTIVYLFIAINKRFKNRI